MNAPPRIEPGPPGRLDGPLVWYASYGSNMHRARLDCYLAGGRPPGGTRTYPGCRDRRPPARTSAVLLPGEMYFALESPVWTGGTAFYDPDVEGLTAAHAHLVTVQQFCDIAAQEMHREPGADPDLTEVLSKGRAELGPGRYEALVCPGLLDGYPVLTFTAPWHMAQASWNAPAAAYLRHVGTGLAQSHGWPHDRSAAYLAARPGAAGHWSAEAVTALLDAESADAR